MTSSDLIYCANRAENLRKALHKKDKMSPYDCKEYRRGVLDVLCVLGFIADPDESLDIINKAGAWYKVKHGEWLYKSSYYEADECNCSLCSQLMTTARGVRMNYCPNCGAKMYAEGGERVEKK